MGKTNPTPTLSPAQRIRLAQSILGHVTEDDDPVLIESAITLAGRALQGYDLVADAS